MTNLKMSSWYALQVAPNMEIRVVAALSAKGYESFTPTYSRKRSSLGRVRVSESPLFPGYVFFRLSQDNTGLAIATAGVRRIVAFGGKPCPILEQEIEALQKIIRSEAKASQCAFIREGEKVMVGEGPLAGVVGTLLKIKKNRKLVVSIDILMRSIAVDIGSYTIVSAEGPSLRVAA